MLQKIPGIEPAHLQQVKDQTAKQVVRGSQGIKITDKTDSEEEKKKREWFKPGTREELAALIEEVNEELEKQGSAHQVCPGYGRGKVPGRDPGYGGE